MARTPAIRPGDTPLHAVLRDKSCTLEEVREILDGAGSAEEVNALVNSRSLDGFTPLMLAVSGGNARGAGSASRARTAAVARLLLANGAAATADAHSSKRRTAADYAEIHGSRDLAGEIRRAERMALIGNSSEAPREAHPGEGGQGNAVCTGTGGGEQGEPQILDGDGSGIVVQRPGEKHTRCRLCGDRLSGCRFSAARLEVEAGVQRNSLIVELFSTDVGGEGRQVSGWGQLDWDILSSPALHHVNRRRGFTRELTEALAMLAALRRVMAAHRRQGEQEGGVEEPWHVVDLCCGKGFLATLVAVSFPSFAVTAIDRRSGAFLPHFEAAGITNIRYAQLDVMSPGFPDEVSRLVEAAGRRRPVAVLGMHLCGLLSVRAAELLWEVPGVEAVVLAPCCLPNARYAEDTPPAVYQGADQQEKFTRWCDFLETRISSGGEGVQRAKGSPVPVTCTREVVEAIVSDKRTVLTASRVRLSTQRDEAAAPLRDFL